MTGTILIVDDEPANLAILRQVLSPEYSLAFARSGAEALTATEKHRPALILLDVLMPGMDGYTVCRKLKENADTANIPVIFVTSLTADEDEEKGLSLGAVDYITKPIHATIVLARIKTHLGMKSIRDQLRTQNIQLEAKVQERTEALEIALERAEAAHASLHKTYFSMLRSFGELAELRGGSGVGAYSHRVADLVRQVALRMGMTDMEIQDAFVAGLLHDIGMLGFPDTLYHKPVNALTSEELHVYRQHTSIGAKMIARIETMESVAKIIEHHHEHYDGGGYPLGLSGLQIPLGSRIVLAASDYDNFKHGKLTSKPYTAKQSCQYLLDQRGKRYDPMVVDILEPLIAEDENFEIDEVRIEALYLQPGMVTSRDIHHHDGFLFLSKNTVFSQMTIDQLLDVERRAGTRFEIFIHRN